MSLQSTTTSPAWEILYELARKQMYPHPSSLQRSVLKASTVLCPLIGLLYVISGLKRLCDRDARWLVRIDAGGYMYLNGHLVIPIWGCIFTAVNIAALVCLQMDFASFPKWHTLVLHNCSNPLLLCFGWSRVWSFSYAAPPTAFRLDSNRQLRSTNYNYRKFLGSKLYNAGNIAMYIIPIVYILPFLIINAKNVQEIHRVWAVCVQQHEILASLHKGSENPSEVTNLNNRLQSDMFRRLGTLQDLNEGILLNSQYICLGLIIFQIILLCVFSSATWRIMIALWAQVRTLRECASRRCLSLAAVNQNIRVQSPTYAEVSDTIELYHQKSAWNAEVSDSLWQSSLFEDRRENWEKVDEVMLKQKHDCLRRYAFNALCQAILIIVTVSAYFTLTIITLTNALDVPRRTRLLDLQVINMVWHNVIWNCGLGISLGVISCIVVFSPTPSPITEQPALRRRDSDSF